MFIPIAAIAVTLIYVGLTMGIFASLFIIRVIND